MKIVYDDKETEWVAYLVFRDVNQFKPIRIWFSSRGYEVDQFLQYVQNDQITNAKITFPNVGLRTSFFWDWAYGDEK